MASSSDKPEEPAAAPPSETASVDIKAVLSAALHRAPPEDLADRVMSRVNFVETVANFATLVGLVPARAATASIAAGDRETRSDDDEPAGQDS